MLKSIIVLFIINTNVVYSQSINSLFGGTLTIHDIGNHDLIAGHGFKIGIGLNYNFKNDLKLGSELSLNTFSAIAAGYNLKEQAISQKIYFGYNLNKRYSISMSTGYFSLKQGNFVDFYSIMLENKRTLNIVTEVGTAKIFNSRNIFLSIYLTFENK